MSAGNISRDGLIRGTTLVASFLTTLALTQLHVSSYVLQRNFSRMRFISVPPAGLPLCSGSLEAFRKLLFRSLNL